MTGTVEQAADNGVRKGAGRPWNPGADGTRTPGPPARSAAPHSPRSASARALHLLARGDGEGSRAHNVPSGIRTAVPELPALFGVEALGAPAEAAYADTDPGAEFGKNGIYASGRVTVDRIGFLDVSRTFTISMGGGAESNVAVAAARLGADVTWAGRLGGGSVGDLIERRLRTEGVRSRITRDDGFTGLVVCSRRTNAGVRVDYHRAGSAGSRPRKAGAAFTVASGDDEDVFAESLDAGIPHLPGVCTPSEASRAQRRGLRWVKAFPASHLGPS